MNARKTVLDLLLKMDKGGYSPIVLDNALKSPISGSDNNFSSSAFVTTLFYGVLERRITLDYVIDKFASSKPDALVRALLRMSVYELMFLLCGNKHHAVVNEAVELAPKRAKGFVNAVLRNFLRFDKDCLDREIRGDLSLEYSCPQWLIRKWQGEYGEDATLAILQTSLLTAPKFERGGYVQDKSSYDACAGLNPKSGDVVLDLCAAPGGKSLTIARLMHDTGRVISCDINAKKLNLLAKSAEKLELGVIETRVNDAKVFNPDFPPCDKVVCDVPCSGLGVIRRKPEIKYKPPEEFEALPEIQLAILRTGSRYVKVGGVLMYSTCTLSRAENDDVVAAFLAADSHFELMTSHTTIPTEDGGDGFFVAYLKRTRERTRGETPELAPIPSKADL